MLDNYKENSHTCTCVRSKQASATLEDRVKEQDPSFPFVYEDGRVSTL